jgi:translation initiation factor IF-2
MVAINKIDLSAANPGKVKQELSNLDLLIEEFGGNVLCAEISAKKGTGVDHLLELILLQAEVMELTAPFSGPAQGVVVEAKLDRGMGAVATVLLTAGKLEVGSPFICGLISGRVRAMRNERGENVYEDEPSSPVQVLGFGGVPQAGDTFHVVHEEREAKNISNVRQRLKREQEFSRHRKMTLNQLFERIEAGEVQNLNLIIKGDVDGSVEALSDALEKLSTNEVKLEVIHRGVGAITENDVILASASQAIVIGFHVRPDNRAREAAQREGVDIRLYRVIYEVVDNIHQAMEGLLSAEEKETLLSSVEVREVYKISKVGTVAGCLVTEGKVSRNHRARLIRDGVVIWEGNLASLKRFKDDVRDVSSGFECGIKLENFMDIKVEDIIETFIIEEVKRQLSSRVSE